MLYKKENCTWRGEWVEIESTCFCQEERIPERSSPYLNRKEKFGKKKGRKKRVFPSLILLT